LFGEKVNYASTNLQVQELFEYFENVFPQCEENLDFFLAHLSNKFGEGGQVWEENRHHVVEAYYALMCKMKSIQSSTSGARTFGK
jgi:hypothetical protein